MFVDHIRVYCKAGDGGNGVVHFRREKYLPKGGPDGGDGGDGGDIIIECSNHTDNLKAFFYDPKLVAKGGGHGAGQRKHGKNGKTVIAKVPPGTVIYRSPAIDLQEAVAMERDEGIDLDPVVDLTEHGQTYVLCKGGKGGKGNWHYKSSTNRAPEEHTLGTEGDLGVFYFELRRIADAGMVGFPNAGKSTLVSKLSAAKPKIASYPFTTLKPMVGVVEFPGFKRCTVADIPGLIEGAHQNRGLGHEFLRHITRCHLLLFVIDMAGVDGRDPIEDLQTLRAEISMYDEDLAKFDWIVIANKMDLEGADENLKNFKQRFPKVKIIPISADQEEGLDDVRSFLCETVAYQPNK
ncbi:GTP-binding protein [Rubritalea squalenifaciens DSM 18772]|uniref:GTPase Obg n=2 Tax=Rubritalea TaxID=361050 RepID=A0A1M6IG57_9BACT|nr:GTPase ObgE [Rubritalea squalenifaciens]SHJ33410.1 GTP-binding protein [Rubritalea squalenifaciens DSM 18772]